MTQNERLFKEALLDALRKRCPFESARRYETLHEGLSSRHESRFRETLLRFCAEASEEVMARYLVKATILRSWRTAQRLALEALAERRSEVNRRPRHL